MWLLLPRRSVSISSPSGEGGGSYWSQEELEDVQEAFPLVLLQVKAVGLFEEKRGVGGGFPNVSISSPSGEGGGMNRRMRTIFL